MGTVYCFSFGSFRSVVGNAAQTQQITLTNLFEDSSFTVEKEYIEMDIDSYKKEYGISSFVQMMPEADSQFSDSQVSKSSPFISKY